MGLFDRNKKQNARGGKPSKPEANVSKETTSQARSTGNNGVTKQNTPQAKPVRMESVILKEIWSVAKDNFDDYLDHATRADVHRLNASTAVKPDAKSDEAYA
jgi:hypothetical protein